MHALCRQSSVVTVKSHWCSAGTAESVASGALRQALKKQGYVLGPWVPGRAFFQKKGSALRNACTSCLAGIAESVASSALRQALNKQDDVLGPWVPGRDPLEDALAAYAGEALGPLILNPEEISAPQITSCPCCQHAKGKDHDGKI